MTLTIKMRAGFTGVALISVVLGWLGCVGITGTFDNNWILIPAILCIGLMLAIGYYVPKSINRKILNLTSGFSDVADQVASAASQVSSSSESLAEGSSEQAASFEEVSSTLLEMTNITKQNASSAAQARSISNETIQTTESCSNVMQEMAAAIGQVSDSSEETQKIVKTVDQIAFQTNLLALNAAVEAARAGEAGSGFAVVADEVRNLAMRASDATKNTSKQIEDISKKINGAIEMVFKCIEEFAKVDENTRKVNDLVDSFATASNDQANGIEQISKAVSEMDRVVQQNAANAEESAAASEQMLAQAESTKDLVGRLMLLLVGEYNHNKNQHTMIPRTTTNVFDTTTASSKMSNEKRDTSVEPLKEVRPDQLIPLDDEAFNDF